jgi:hypothetical protein
MNIPEAKKCKHVEDNSVVHKISKFCSKTQSSCGGYDYKCPDYEEALNEHTEH